MNGTDIQNAIEIQHDWQRQMKEGKCSISVLSDLARYSLALQTLLASIEYCSHSSKVETRSDLLSLQARQDRERIRLQKQGD